MRPPFNSFPQRPQQQQNNGYSNHHHPPNGYRNPANMMNPQMMNNPMMGHMNNQIPMPNMPIHPQFYNNMHQQQQQQQLQQFGFNHLLPNLLGSLQFAVANNNLMGHSLPLAQPGFFQPPLGPPSAFTSQPQLNNFNYNPLPNPHQNQHLQPPGFAQPRPHLGQSVNNANGNDFQNKFTKHQKGSGQGFQRPQFNQTNDAKKKFGFNKDHKGKGKNKKMQTGLDGSDAGKIAKKKKRLPAWFYTPKEIQQWREARRKNFPTKLNVKKNVKKNVSESNLDDDAKLRRQQLQEVLAKQAELGVEVAEVPSHYLANTEEKANEDRGDNNGQTLNGKPFQYNNERNGRFQNNRRNKRRPGEKDRFNKKSRFQDQNSSQESSITTREPTLLEKLLSRDIKRDKSQLLQVFRFMVINSFFSDLPEQPLKLPLVMVEETGSEHAREDAIAEVLCDDHYDDDDDDDDDDDVDINMNGDEAVER